MATNSVRDRSGDPYMEPTPSAGGATVNPHLPTIPRGGGMPTVQQWTGPTLSSVPVDAVERGVRGDVAMARPREYAIASNPQPPIDPTLISANDNRWFMGILPGDDATPGGVVGWTPKLPVVPDDSPGTPQRVGGMLRRIVPNGNRMLRTLLWRNKRWQ